MLPSKIVQNQCLVVISTTRTAEQGHGLIHQFLDLIPERLQLIEVHPHALLLINAAEPWIRLLETCRLSLSFVVTPAPKIRAPMTGPPASLPEKRGSRHQGVDARLANKVL
jgi:hypothetical protein